MKKALLLSFLLSLNIFGDSLNPVSLINPSDEIANFLQSFIFEWNAENNNSNFIAIEDTENQDLTCIQVDYVNSTSGWAKDDTAIFSENLDTTTTITDPNFERALIDLGLDSGNIDGVVLTANVAGVDSLNVSGRSITNLTGIEDFKVLTYLDCSDNQLTSLNISANTVLARLYCNNNRLASLNLKNGYDITESDRNVFNLLSRIIGTYIPILDTRENPDLACIETNNTRFRRVAWSAHDPSVVFIENCSTISIITTSIASITPTSAMLSGNIIYDGGNTIIERGFVYSLSSTAVLTIGSTDVYKEISSSTGTGVFSKNIMNLRETTTYYYTAYATNINDTVYGVAKSFSTIPIGATYIQDSNFEQALIDLGLDSGNTNGFVITAGIADVDSLDVSSTRSRNRSITNLTGIEDFEALTYLDCSSNQLTSFDISANTALTSLDCSNSRLTSLDVSANTALTTLDCAINRLTTLDFFTNTDLTTLDCRLNNLESLDFSTNTALTSLDCQRNKLLTSLNVSTNTALTSLDCGFNNLESLDVSTNTALTILNCNVNKLTSLNVSANKDLTDLSCSTNKLTSLDVSANKDLTELNCQSNNLTELNVRDTNNHLFTFFLARNNPKLICIQVDNVAYSMANWLRKDVTAIFSENCNSLGSKDFQATNIYVSPNPVTNILYIKNINDTKVEQVKIFNILGKLIYDKENRNNQIDFSNFSKAIYILKLIDQEGRYTIKKVLKE